MKREDFIELVQRNKHYQPTTLKELIELEETNDSNHDDLPFFLPFIKSNGRVGFLTPELYY